MAKMVNFVLYLFYHNFKNQKVKKKENQSFSTFRGRTWNQPPPVNSTCSCRFYKAGEDTAFTPNQRPSLLHTMQLTWGKNLGYSKP